MMLVVVPKCGQTGAWLYAPLDTRLLGGSDSRMPQISIEGGLQQLALFSPDLHNTVAGKVIRHINTLPKSGSCQSRKPRNS
jgi:hypothetical protein